MQLYFHKVLSDGTFVMLSVCIFQCQFLRWKLNFFSFKIEVFKRQFWHLKLHVFRLGIGVSYGALNIFA